MKKFSMDKQVRYLFAYLGVDEQELLDRAELPSDLFESSSIELDTAEYFRMFDALALSGNFSLPLALRMLNIPMFSMMSPPVMAALCAPNFIVCVERLQEFKPLIGPLQLTLDKDGQHYSVAISAQDPRIKLHEQVIAMELLFFVALVRHATGKTIVPHKVTSTVPLEHPGYAEYLGCEVSVAEENSVQFRLGDASESFTLRNDSAWEFFEPEMRKRLSELEQDDTFAASVRAVLMELLPLGKTAMTEVAGKLFVSPRTLQRKLQLENTSFQAQLNHSRELLSRHYLSNSSMSITEIAFLVGYNESSSFTRAFSSWVGESPESFRSSKTE